jgi:hypothetical protein
MTVDFSLENALFRAFFRVRNSLDFGSKTSLLGRPTERTLLLRQGRFPF